MRREKTIIITIFLFALLLWGVDVLFRFQASDWGVWLWRKELINLTGILAFIPMGIIMILALRPPKLEWLFGGMDKIYYAHKWLGIWSIVFVILHYGMKLSKGILKPFFEQGPKPKDPKLWIFDGMQSLAKDMGEILFYAFVIMLVITLLKRFPYRFWRLLHKLMGLFFIGVVFHALVLSPARYWTEPVGIVMLLLMAFGIYSAIIAILGRIGQKRRYQATITELDFVAKTAVVTCEMPRDWNHQAGQYAFVQHPQYREKHPFTIASMTRKDQTICFAIKALGHYTRKISKRWQVGDELIIEGPYGRFFSMSSTLPKQLWVAGGVGITPFIAWLESLQRDNQQLESRQKAITLYYLVRNSEEALMLTELQALAEKANVTLHLHYSDDQGHLDFATLPFDADTSVWFCGPTGIAKAISRQLSLKGLAPHRYLHCEYFEMR